MSLAFCLLAAVAPGDALELRESVRLEGRFVRLIDLVDASALGETDRSGLSRVYLGRVPEAGRARIITAEAIRRQMEYRGLDPARFSFSREEVEVRGPGRPEAGTRRPEPAVRNRSLVRAVSPDYEVDARALQDGAVGDEILLEYASSQRRFRGRVLESGRVEVSGGAR